MEPCVGPLGPSLVAYQIEVRIVGLEADLLGVLVAACILQHAWQCTSARVQSTLSLTHPCAHHICPLESQAVLVECVCACICVCVCVCACV